MIIADIIYRANTNQMSISKSFPPKKEGIIE